MVSFSRSVEIQASPEPVWAVMSDIERWPEWTPTDCRSAQEMLRSATREYAAALRQVDPARLGDMVELPMGSFPLAQCSGFPSFDLMHHHGQVAYIQTLLGDQEDHFQAG